MARSYSYISGDSHLEIDSKYWLERVPAKYRDQAPRLVRQPDGSDAWKIADKIVRPAAAADLYGGKGRDKYVPFDGKYEGTPGTGSPEQRIREQDRDGIDAEVPGACRGDGHGPILEAQRRVARVVLDPQPVEAEDGCEPVGGDERRRADRQPAIGRGVDGKKLEIPPDPGGSCRDRLPADARRHQPVVVVDLEGTEARRTDVRQADRLGGAAVATAHAHDAAGSSALEATLRTTSVNGAPDTPVTNIRLIVKNVSPYFYDYVSGVVTFYDNSGVRCAEGMFKADVLAVGESIETDTPGIRITCAPSSWRIVATNLVPRSAGPTAPPTEVTPSSTTSMNLLIDVDGQEHPIQLGKPMVVNLGGARRTIIVRRSP